MPNVRSPGELNEEYFESLSRGKFYEDYKPISIPSRMYEEVKLSKDRTIIKLIDKNQRDDLSVVCGEFTEYHGKEYFEIRYTWSKNKGRGYLTYLFQLIVYDLNLIIISDGTHTSPGSKEFWISHIKKNNFEVFRYDIKSNYKRNAKRYKPDEIWGLTTPELEEIELEKANYQLLQGTVENAILNDEYLRGNELNLNDNDNNVDLLEEFDDEIEETNQLVTEYETFISSYRELKKSKHEIRLIAQKTT